MILVCMFAERIPGPTLSDRILSIVPYTPIIARFNYHIWAICYLPVGLYIWRLDRNRFVEFMYAGGIMSLLRGFTIFLTTLGPVNGHDINAGKPIGELLRAWVDIVNPLSLFGSDVAHVYLTKDLFFSGHTASTFLLVLYAWRYRQLRWLAIIGHVIVVTTVFMSHLHYSIDVVGGLMAAFVVYTLTEKFFARYPHNPLKQ